MEQVKLFEAQAKLCGVIGRVAVSCEQLPDSAGIGEDVVAGILRRRQQGLADPNLPS